MNVLAIKSSGDHTSVSVILDEDINTYSMSHERKERPDWNLFLSNVGYKKSFNLEDIDLFAFASDVNLSVVNSVQIFHIDYFLLDIYANTNFFG